MAHHRLKTAPKPLSGGLRHPRSHRIEHDIARQLSHIRIAINEDGRITSLKKVADSPMAPVGSQRHRNIERCQDVTLVIDRRDLPYYAVMVQGRAEIGSAPSPALLLRMATRYVGAERGADYTAQRNVMNSVTIHIHPNKFVDYQGVVGHTPSRV